ncbi:MAG: 2-iminoacetate synthase ThiH, partial [Duncaniella sp.]|nr:2-iminoacetate synthase ThiH [Duncaniella sp.]
MFSEYLKANWDWDTTTREIEAMTAADVERALAREHLDDRDFMALVSPAAAPYIEQMARRSRALTEQRFGKTVSIFIPMYITNSCTNACVYCGFNR